MNSQDGGQDLTNWSPKEHSQFGLGLNALFGTWLLAIRALENAGQIEALDLALQEEMLSAWCSVPKVSLCIFIYKVGNLETYSQLRWDPAHLSPALTLSHNDMRVTCTAPRGNSLFYSQGCLSLLPISSEVVFHVRACAPPNALFGLFDRRNYGRGNQLFNARGAYLLDPVHGAVFTNGVRRNLRLRLPQGTVKFIICRVSGRILATVNNRDMHVISDTIEPFEILHAAVFLDEPGDFVDLDYEM